MQSFLCGQLGALSFNYVISIIIISTTVTPGLLSPYDYPGGSIITFILLIETLRLGEVTHPQHLGGKWRRYN